MTFGQTLKQLMSVSGVKSAHLADALGYDTSYISRWANDIKMPSLKNNDDLFDKISSYIVANCDEAAQRNLCLAYSVPDAQLLGHTISEVLRTTYCGSANDSFELSTAPNSVYAPSGYLPGGNRLFTDAIIQSAQANGTGTVNCVTSEAISTYDIYNNKGKGFWETIISHPDIMNKISVVTHQLVNMNEFAKNIDAYCAAICCYADYDVDMRYELYKYEPDSSVSPVHFTAVEDRLLLQSFTNPISGAESVIACTDKAVLKTDYLLIQKKLAAMQKLLTYSLGHDDSNNHFLYDYVMDGRLRYILNTMHPIFMSDSFAQKIMDEYVPEMSNDDFQGHYHNLCAKSEKEVVIYRSALLEYIYSGSIFIFGKTVRLSKADRKIHLEELLDNIRNGKCSLTILSDINPLLNRRYIRLSVYLSPNTGFAVSSASEKELMVRFRSHRMIGYFNEFFEHFQALPKEYALSGKDAENFLQRGLSLV